MTNREFSENDIHLALDGEMPVEERPAFERWLDAHPDMQARSHRFATDRDRLRETLAGILEEPVPPRLSGMPLIPEEAIKGPPRLFWRSFAAAAILLVGGLGGFILGRMNWGTPLSGENVADKAIAAHVLYASETRHVVEVGADQKDHLVGWLSKRVGIHLVAPDFSGVGFKLVGGRLLPSAHKAAAQFMYQDHAGVRISLYVVRDPGSHETSFRLLKEDGARAFYWLDNGCGYAVAGNVPENTLLTLANLAYTQLDAAVTGGSS
ncbi:MAG TPA: anti-sigma factor [Rhizobiaceae bacterium]|nr:anti-sigma factor [Rhizobiaceae bacterium]